MMACDIENNEVVIRLSKDEAYKIVDTWSSHKDIVSCKSIRNPVHMHIMDIREFARDLPSDNDTAREAALKRIIKKLSTKVMWQSYNQNKQRLAIEKMKRGLTEKNLLLADLKKASPDVYDRVLSSHGLKKDCSGKFTNRGD